LDNIVRKTNSDQQEGDDMDFAESLTNMTDTQLDNTFEVLSGELRDLESLNNFSLFDLIVYEIILDRMELVKHQQDLQKARPN
jgi:hypothetical protein